MAKNIKLLFSFSLLLVVIGMPLILQAQNKEVKENISLFIKKGDATKLATFFNKNIDLTVPGSIGIYSKNQAEQILKVFFKENVVSSFEVKFEGLSKDGSSYAIGELKSNTKIYRVYFLIKPSNSSHLIHQLQIEKE